MPEAPSSPASPPGEPESWSRRQPGRAVAVVVGLFVSVLLLRVVAWDSANPYSVLYVIPVAVAATVFGKRGGILASLVAVVLLLVTTPLRVERLDIGGWTTRLVPILLLGVLLGHAADRARAAEEDRRRFEVAALLHRQAIEINDSIVQRMTVAKWALEAGNTEAGLAALTEAVGEAHRLVSGLIRRADLGGRTEPVSGAGTDSDDAAS